MARVKRGVHSKKSHKAVMDRAKGFRGARSRRFKVAKEAVMHAERYAYRDRRARKGDFRRLWITRINAAARMDGLSYSRFMHGLKLAEVDVDRKILADLAVREPAGFSALVGVAKDALGEVADTTSGGPTDADEPARSSADVAGGVAGTDTVGSVEADEIIDDANAPAEADDDAAEVADADDEAEVEENVLVETDAHDEVDLTDDATDEADDVTDDAADEADDVTDDDVSLAKDSTVDSDDDGSVNAADESPFGEGSAKADDDGAGPEGWTVKGNADSMLYHTEESPYYGRTKAEVWFETEAAAAGAGFERWDHMAPADDEVEVVDADDDAADDA